MIHVPFLNFDIPEPSLYNIVPDALRFLLRVLSKIHYLTDSYISPESPEDLHQAALLTYDLAPRELKNVLRRWNEGKIKNDEQLSSEYVEASYDWYRRMIRTYHIGATDENLLEVSLQKTGLNAPDALEKVLLDYRENNALIYGGDIAQQLQIESPEEKAKLDAYLKGEAEKSQAVIQEEARLSQETEHLQLKVKSRNRLIAEVAMQTAAGVLLGIAIIRLTKFTFSWFSGGDQQGARAPQAGQGTQVARAQPKPKPQARSKPPPPPRRRLR